MAFSVKHFESITASMVNFFSGNNSTLTDFNIGSRLRTILESVAIEMEQIYYQLFVGINDGIKTGVYDSFSFPLLQARAATGTVRFSRLTPAPVGGTTIPAGTAVSTQGSDSEEAVTFQTVEEVIILEAATFIDATVIADLPGTTGNVNATTIKIFLAQPAGVDTVINPADFFSGRDLESEDERQNRFQKFIANLSRSTLGAIEGAALTVPNVFDAKAVESPDLKVFVFSAATVTYTDVSFEANLPSGSPIPMFPTAISLNDVFYVGDASRFDSLKIDLDAIRAGGAIIWEYWNGTAWVTLPFVSDSTNLLTSSGFLSFTKPSDWVANDINDVRKFWLRLRVTNPAISQNPTLFQITAPPFPGIVFVVVMDAAGTASIALRNEVAVAVEEYRAAGIHVSVREPVLTNVDVTALVIATPEAPDTLKADLETEISNFLTSFLLGKSLVLSELIQIIENFSSEILEVVIQLPTDSIDSSFDEVLRPGTITVTVQK